jgi:hypothetical protein
MVKSQKEECEDDVLCAFHYEFISWKLVILIRAIDSENTILLIYPLRVTGSHPAEAAGGGSTATAGSTATWRW